MCKPNYSSAFFFIYFLIGQLFFVVFARTKTETPQHCLLASFGNPLFCNVSHLVSAYCACELNVATCDNLVVSIPITERAESQIIPSGVWENRGEIRVRGKKTVRRNICGIPQGSAASFFPLLGGFLLVFNASTMIILSNIVLQDLFKMCLLSVPLLLIICGDTLPAVL